MSSIRLLLADDQALVRGALAALLGLEADLDVVAEVERGDQVLEAVRANRVDVALLDIEMAGMTGIEVVAELAAEAPAVRSLIVTTFGRPGFLRRALDAGAAGFVVKDTPAPELIDAVRRVHAGMRVVDPDLAADNKRYVEIMRRYAELGEIASVGAELRSATETLDVARMLHAEAEADERDAWRAEIASAETSIETLEQQIRMLLLPKDPNDGRNVIIEIRGAEGGEEAVHAALDTLLAETLREEYAAKIAGAEKDAEAMLENAQKEADGIVKKAKEDTTAMIARRERMAQDKIAAAERQAVDELRARAADASTAAAAKLIAANHDAAADRALADEVIGQI